MANTTWPALMASTIWPTLHGQYGRHYNGRNLQHAERDAFCTADHGAGVDQVNPPPRLFELLGVARQFLRILITCAQACLLCMLPGMLPCCRACCRVGPCLVVRGHVLIVRAGRACWSCVLATCIGSACWPCVLTVRACVRACVRVCVRVCLLRACMSFCVCASVQAVRRAAGQAHHNSSCRCRAHLDGCGSITHVAYTHVHPSTHIPTQRPIPISSMSPYVYLHARLCQRSIHKITDMHIHMSIHMDVHVARHVFKHVAQRLCRRAGERASGKLA